MSNGTARKTKGRAIKNEWHAGRMLVAIARHFDWWSNRMATEAEIDGGIADLLFISRAGYATEIEIKVTRADWNTDRDKSKWRRDRPHIARFFYAVPDSIADSVPDWVPAHAGLLTVRNAGDLRGDRCYVRRDATRFRATKLSDDRVRRIFDNCYYRYWRQRLDILGKRLRDEQRERGTAP